METLVELIKKEGIGLSLTQISELFQQLVNEGKLDAYRVELDSIIEETEDFVKRKKGATLTKTKTLNEGIFFVEDPKTKIKYHVDLNRQNYAEYERRMKFADHYWVIEKILPNIDYRKVVAQKNNPKRARIPEKYLDAKFKGEYHEEIEMGEYKDKVSQTRGTITIQGKGARKNWLFDMILKYSAKSFYQKEKKSLK